MKLKSAPEDFRVDEITSVVASKGAFGLYRLSKSGLGTPEAVQEILNKWQLPRNALNYGGLKDRHAQTTQYLTIYRGPRAELTDRSYRLEYLGQCDRAYHSKDILANRFEIRLRGISPKFREALTNRFTEVDRVGVVNYFDDQRFGSIGHSGELIGVPWCLGNYERALYLAMAESNSHDRPREREQKEILREYWGDWLKCKAMLDRSHRRSIVTYLCDHPTDFKRAVALIRQDLRGIYISAFQSWVWNRWLSRLIDRCEGGASSAKLPSACGQLSLPILGSNDAQSRWQQLTEKSLPLPSARQHDWPYGTLEVLEETLAPLELSVRQMRLKYPRDTFFSRGLRDIVLRPRGMQQQWSDDTLNASMLCWTIRFELPRGSYATMVVRNLMRVMDGSEQPVAESPVQDEIESVDWEDSHDGAVSSSAESSTGEIRPANDSKDDLNLESDHAV